MKRFFVAFAALLLAVGASAQVGVVGGITSAETKVKNLDVKSVTQYHAGIAFKNPLGMGFVLQPEILYNVKGSRLDGIAGLSDIDTTTGFLELGAQLQWGPQLDGARPFVFAEPFLGYAVDCTVADQKISGDAWDGFNRLEYGAAIGAGVDVGRHLQLSARYFWNVGKLYNDDGSIQSAIVKTVTNALKDGTPGGIQVSAAFFF